MLITDTMAETGAIALFAAVNADGNIAEVKPRWPTYSDEMRTKWLQWSRVVLEAALSEA